MIIGTPFGEGFRESNRFCGVEIEKPDSFHEIVVYEEIAKVGSGGLLWGLMGGTGIGVPPILKFGGKYL